MWATELPHQQNTELTQSALYSASERPERGGPCCWLLKLRQMGTQRVQKTRVFPWWFFGLVVPVQKIFVLPWLLVLLNKFFFISPYIISIHLSPSPSKLGSGQAVVLGRLLSLSISIISLSLRNGLYDSNSVLEFLNNLWGLGTK